MTHTTEEASSADAAWMRQKDWACGRIHSTGVARLVLWWVVAGLWNGFILILISIFWGNPGEQDVIKVLSLFGLVGLGLFVWAVRRTWAWLRYGGAVLELSSTPGVIGGTLEGQIHTGIQTFPTKPIQIILTCLRKRNVVRRVQGNKESDTTTDILWQTDRSVALGQFTRGLRGLTIPLRVAIPFGLPSSDSSDMDNQIHWQLVVSCELPGIDFWCEFLVPVFVTAATKRDWTKEKVDEMADQERKAASCSESSRAKSGVSPVTIRRTQPGGMEYIFRIDLPLKMVTGLFFLSVLVCAGSFGLYLWLGELGPFAVLPGIIGLLLLFAAIGAWTFKSRVLIENGLVRVRKCAFGIPFTWKIHFTEISQVRVRREELDGVQEKERSWDIEIGRKEGRPIRLGASIRERSEAVRLSDQIRQLVQPF